MKQRPFLYAIVAAMFLVMSACGASSANSTMDMADAAAAEPAEAPAMEEVATDEDYTEEAAEGAVENAAAGGTTESTGLIQGAETGSLADKIIYTAYANLETTDLDQSIDTLNGLVEQYGAFLESSSVTGNNLLDIAAGYRYGRCADFTLRVPKEHYSVGNVVTLSSNAENITAQYSDVETQVKSYDTQEQRLLEIMAQADTVEDMIALESRLSDVRMEKDRLETQLQNWDRQVEYSTVTISLTEVEVLTPEPPAEEPTYLEQLGQTFMDSVHWMGRAAKGGVKLLVAVIPVLLPVAVIILVVVLICKAASRRKLRKREKAMEHQKKEDNEP